MNKIKKVPHLWGDEYILENNELYCGKILAIYAGGSSSAQYHRKKDETFIVLRGVIELIIGDCIGRKVLKEGDIIRIKPHTTHCFRAVPVKLDLVYSIWKERFEIFGLNLNLPFSTSINESII